jgi:hypothetical protein
LRRCKAGNRDAVGGAGDVVEADFVAEGDGGRFAAVFAADAEFDVRADLLGEFDADFHQWINADVTRLSQPSRGKCFPCPGDPRLSELPVAGASRPQIV